MTSASTLIEQVIDAWQNMRGKTPLVQCTNSVAANYTANVLLASGASPAMIDNPYETESFTKISSALSINLGTPTSEQMQAMQISAKTAQLNGIPWVLDPVGYGPILAWRSQMTDELLVQAKALFVVMLQKLVHLQATKFNLKVSIVL